jgi:hypothetical protein
VTIFIGCVSRLCQFVRRPVDCGDRIVQMTRGQVGITPGHADRLLA